MKVLKIVVVFVCVWFMQLSVFGQESQKFQASELFPYRYDGKAFSGKVSKSGWPLSYHMRKTLENELFTGPIADINNRPVPDFLSGFENSEIVHFLDRTEELKNIPRKRVSASYDFDNKRQFVDIFIDIFKKPILWLMKPLE